MVRPPIPGLSRSPIDLAAATTTGGSKGVPLAPGSPNGNAEQDHTVADVPHTPATAPESTGDTTHTAALYPELEALPGWAWWWVGLGPAVPLAGRYRYPDQAVDLRSIGSDADVALTRVHPLEKLPVQQSGRLVEVLAPLTQDPR